MTRRRIEAADFFRVTVNTRKAPALINRHQLFTQILPEPIFVMTLGTRRDRHIRLQPAQRCGFRDVDVARRALRHVLFLLTATFMNELRGDPHRLGRNERRVRELVTAVAARGDWILRLPVTVETRSVIRWRCFERRAP